MNEVISKKIDDLFSSNSATDDIPVEKRENCLNKPLTFSYLFFSDVRKDVTEKDKYYFMHELVEFADQSGFEAVYFPERHFYEFGSIYANNSIVAAYFAPITRNIRLRTAAVTATLHHPVEIVENWAMVDILSDGRVDLGFGNGWNKADFILSPDTYADRVKLRNERIPVIQQLWRGDTVDFPGPGGEMFPITVYPRPVQPELNVWYVTNSIHGFEHAGAQGYNIFTMLMGGDLDELATKIKTYREAREKSGFDAGSGIVSLMMHTFVHPDNDWVERVVEQPFKDYIRSSLISHMKAAGNEISDKETEKMIDYSYARYFNTCGMFGSPGECQRQLDKARSIGVNDIAFLQDFGVDYDSVRNSLEHLHDLVQKNAAA